MSKIFFIIRNEENKYLVTEYQNIFIDTPHLARNFPSVEAAQWFIENRYFGKSHLIIVQVVLTMDLMDMGI
jgi:hypothetical protein